ncbi:hypothetical protein BWQ93_05985 [Sphingopyxis sp. QXT-31]|uniref:hypothetical protein n=1 Tax=Sphingopyxis sp. QXT-31 TaxID=1357916 RepID=UPI0009791020|nr:hypothetical protein [Sphingopyxis sp. QXT-31]APZ98080.1 hypothetical protein BWQ93_05985 [Sphingopyxis sp. QXT-31]
MTFLEYLDRVGERRQARALKRVAILPNDFRGWLGFGLFLQSTMLFLLIAAVPSLRESQGFLTLASAVIVTGWIGGAAAFAYAAGKRDAEQQEQTRQALDLASSAIANNAGGEAGAARQVADAADAEAEAIEARR